MQDGGWGFWIIFSIFIGFGLVGDLSKKILIELKRIRRLLEYQADINEDDETEFDVIVKSFGPNKKASLKLMKAISNQDFRSASLPIHFMEAISKEEAREIQEQLEEVGAKVSLKGYL